MSLVDKCNKAVTIGLPFMNSLLEPMFKGMRMGFMEREREDCMPKVDRFKEDV